MLIAHPAALLLAGMVDWDGSDGDIKYERNDPHMWVEIHGWHWVV